MKKTTYLIMSLLIAGSALSAQQLGTQMNFGILSDGDLRFNPIYFSGGLGLDFHLGKFLIIRAEGTVYADSHFENFWIFPAGMLNITTGPFFIGGGVGKFVRLAGSAISNDNFSMKANAGFNAGSLSLTFYFITPFTDIFRYFSSGITLGFAF